METILLIKLSASILLGSAVFLLTKYLVTFIYRLQVRGHSLQSGFIISNDSPNAAPLLFKLKDYSTFLLPLVDKLQKSGKFSFINTSLEAYRFQLAVSGLSSYYTVEHVLAIALLTAFLTGILAVFLALLIDLGVLFLIPAFVLGSVIGYYLPGIQLKSWIDSRVKQIERRLPFAIEFILLSIEAGSDFVGAIRAYCKEVPNDPLTDELNIFVNEFLYFGQGQKQSLKSLAERINSSLFASFILAIEVAIETGLPIKETLQIQSKAISQTRYEQAEEVAKGASTKALGPLMMGVVAALLILIGPMVLGLSNPIP